MDQVAADRLITENYITYGRYVNNGRATVSVDGLKSVERRMLLSTVDEARNKFVSSAAVVGRCLAAYHPHGESSSYDVLCRLVLRGLVEGHGSFGSFVPGDTAAAMRYTKVKALSSITNLVFKLIPHVESYENEYGIIEPRHLPTPIPFALATTGSTGIGVGLLSSIPCFQPRSLFAALINDDPTLLRAPKGVDIVSADLTKIWEDGEGYVQYGLKCYQEKSDIDEGRTVSVIEGSPQVFVPDVNKVFAKEIADESVYIRDESTEKVRYVISRVRGLKRITDDDVYTIAGRAAVKTVFARIYVSDGEKAKKTSLRSWLRNCWSVFDQAVSNYKTAETDKINHKIRIFELIPKVYPLLIKDVPTKTIAGQLNETMEIIKEIEGKPLRLIRKRDFDEEIRGLKSSAREIAKIESRELGEEFINNFGG